MLSPSLIPYRASDHYAQLHREAELARAVKQAPSEPSASSRTTQLRLARPQRTSAC
jgi:hypothetical protein